MSSFAYRLSCAANAAQLSDSDLHRWFGVSRNAVVNWLRGDTEPVRCREEIILKLLEALEAKAPELLRELAGLNRWERLHYARKIRDSSLSSDDIAVARTILPLF